MQRKQRIQIMEEDDFPSAAVCRLCGNAYTLPEGEADGNLPRALFCAHIYCTACLQALECDNTIQCPECEVKSTLGENGVFSLYEDSRTTGLVYTAKTNKMKRMKRCRRNKMELSPVSNTSTVKIDQKMDEVVDVALAQATQTLAQLQAITKNFTADSVMRMEMELNQASGKALHAVHKWRERQLAKLGGRSQLLSHLQERIRTLKIAMRMAREVQSVPSVGQYSTLDKVLETLQAPLDEQSFKQKYLAPDRGMCCIFQSEEKSLGLTLSLRIHYDEPKHLSDSPSVRCQPDSFNLKSPTMSGENRNGNSVTPGEQELPHPPSEDQQSLTETSVLSQESFSNAEPPQQHGSVPNKLASDAGRSDVIIEEFVDDETECAPPPTGPELANDQWRIHKLRKKKVSCNTRKVTQWVVVTHIVNPNHFYVQYVAEKKESEILSRKINRLCLRNGSLFTSNDTVETGSLIFAKCEDGLWGRASVVDISPRDGADAVSSCMVTQLSALRVFFPDYGHTKSITIQSKEGSAESTLPVVNSHLRKVSQVISVELGNFAHQVVRCSLKGLVPYDLKRGWTPQANVEFRRIVGSSAVEMLPLGQDADCLFVDLRKAPMDQPSDIPFSVRDQLVFMAVARLFSPAARGMKPLKYHPPAHPKINTKLSAVVSHINSPADFYIQLVDNMESLLLSAKLQDCYNARVHLREDKRNIYCPVVGEACVARFDDELWYRAQVTGYSGGRKVEVCFVDFGNKKILSVSDLRKIKAEFFALPSMAIHCSLSDVVPVQGATWSEACTSRFNVLAHQTLFTVVATAKASRGEPLPVKLFEGGLEEPLTNISDHLVNEELACFKEESELITARLPGDLTIWDPPLEMDSPVAKIDTPNPKNPLQDEEEEEEEEAEEFSPQLKMPTTLKDLEVRVTHISSPSSFYIQFIQNDSQLQRIKGQVKFECALAEPQDVTWKTDSFCAAYVNGVWERGQICSDVTSGDIAEVRRCDYGNTVKVHIDDLRPLPPSLVGSVALECMLDDIRPAGGRSTWTDTACDLFSHYVTKISIKLTIKELTDERPIPVTLWGSNKTGRFINISDFLAKEGLALRIRKPSDADGQQQQKADGSSPEREEHVDKEEKDCPSPPSNASSLTFSTPRRRFLMSAQKIQTPSYHPPELPCLGLVQMNVSAIGENGLIYVRTQDAEVQLERLKERIQQCIKTLPRQMHYTWKSVLGCAVMGPDMLWYRGELLEVLGGHITVQYVDFGSVENIPAVHLYPVLLCEDVPELCLPCRLLGVNPVGDKWQPDAVALMKEVLVNRSVAVNVVELPVDPKGTLTVEIFLDGLNLNEILCQHEHIHMDNTVLAQKGLSGIPPAPVVDDWDINTEGLLDPEEPILGPVTDAKEPEKELFEVQVKHLQTPNEVFVWIVEETANVNPDGETLDEALMRINSNIDSLPHLTSFISGGPCLAEYSDGMYYRAKVMSITSVEPVTVLVQHVDFGSYDTLPNSKLRQMPAELLHFPALALKVKIAGFKASAVKRWDSVLPYSPEWSMKAVMDMMELLKDNLTATVVAREPQLTVLLYNKDGDPVHHPLVSRGLAEFE